MSGAVVGATVGSVVGTESRGMSAETSQNPYAPPRRMYAQPPLTFRTSISTPLPIVPRYLPVALGRLYTRTESAITTAGIAVSSLGFCVGAGVGTSISPGVRLLTLQ